MVRTYLHLSSIPLYLTHDREVAENVTDAQYEELMSRLHIYKAWALDRIFKIHDGGAVLVVLPIETSTPNYRDSPPPPFSLLSGFSPLYLSPIAGTPEVTLPVGKITYRSRISGKEEPMPISVSIVSELGEFCRFLRSWW
jgi:hypothetical protein